MITVIVFGIAAVAALEIMLFLALLGWVGVELGLFLRRHPSGAAGGMRDLAEKAREWWLAACSGVERRWRPDSR